MTDSREGRPSSDARYRRFWADVGASFPTLTGAASTDLYLACEQRLLAEALGDCHGLRILKTDLWDEAKNTRILQWLEGRGSRAFGIDLSPPIVGQAVAAFRPGALGAVVADVRALPFQEAVFDAVYSMGTVEHFDETEQAVGEIARVLRPGGRAVVGVPNRHDPFLRPLLVTVLWWLGLYGYGYEKSFSRRALRNMLQRAGLVVERESGILFIPGWLRMADLACHCWWRPLSRITALAVRPFGWIERRVPRLRRHGYLLATVAIRPMDGRSSER